MLSGLGSCLELILLLMNSFVLSLELPCFTFCYITDYSKIYWLKTINIYYFTISVDQESRHGLPGPSASVSVIVILRLD